MWSRRSAPLTTPTRWEPVDLDLASHAGQEVVLRFRLLGEPGAVGLWGSPVIRSEGEPLRAMTAPAEGLLDPDDMAGQRLSGLLAAWRERGCASAEGRGATFLQDS